jgi:CBS domain containing-hemolysin-like protein
MHSPFAKLSENLTRLLSTIVIASTTCSVYSTALFVTSASALFPQLGLGSITLALTLLTLFFGELLPKALAVANSELVARRLVPLVSRLSVVMLPATALMTLLSNAVLATMGLRSVEDRNVSEDMVRRVVAEAQATSGIESAEGRMIQAVLDLQEQPVDKIMVGGQNSQDS